jgi:hypothetical protein
VLPSRRTGRTLLPVAAASAAGRADVPRQPRRNRGTGMMRDKFDFDGILVLLMFAILTAMAASIALAIGSIAPGLAVPFWSFAAFLLVYCTIDVVPLFKPSSRRIRRRSSLLQARITTVTGSLLFTTILCLDAPFSVVMQLYLAAVLFVGAALALSA